MRSIDVEQLSFAALGLLLAVTSCGVVGDERACTRLACESQVRFERTVVVAPADVVGLVYEVCRNEHCARARLAWQPSGAEFACVTDDGADRASGFTTCRLTTSDWEELRAAGPGSSTPVAFTLVGLARGAPADLVDGDRYTFRLSRGDAGASLAEASAVVTYDVVRPNGPECDPTCKVANVDEL